MTAALSRPPHILFRADARPELGGGHIMRCLSLASALENRGAKIAFASAPGSEDLVPALTRSNHPVITASHPADAPLPPGWHPPDAIFVDLYDSTIEDEAALRKIAPIIAVIEDLPDRTHDCDLLIDQGFGRIDTDYAGRVPTHAQLMLGPNMVPLRPGFAKLRPKSLERRQNTPKLNHILIAMGLTDLGGITARMVTSTRKALPQAHITAIIGPSAQSRAQLETLAENDKKLNVLIDVDDMAEHMAKADLAIGAGGGTSLERCVLGLPSIVIVLADNQRPAALAMAKAGAVIVVDTDSPESIVESTLQNMRPSVLKSLSQKAASVCDGHGAERITQKLLDLIGDKRP